LTWTADQNHPLCVQGRDLHGAPAAEMIPRTDKVFIAIADPACSNYRSMSRQDGWSTVTRIRTRTRPPNPDPEPFSLRLLCHRLASSLDFSSMVMRARRWRPTMWPRRLSITLARSARPRRPCWAATLTKRTLTKHAVSSTRHMAVSPTRQPHARRSPPRHRARPRKHASSAASASHPVPAALPLRDLARETAPTRRSVHRAPARRQAWPRRGRKDDNSIQANSEQQLVSDGGAGTQPTTAFSNVWRRRRAWRLCVGDLRVLSRPFWVSAEGLVRHDVFVWPC